MEIEKNRLGEGLVFLDRKRVNFNKFRTFTSYGGLVFEYFNLLQEEEIDFGKLQIKFDFPLQFLNDKIFNENLGVDFAEFAQKLPKLVGQHKDKISVAKKTQNLALIAEVENEKQSLDLHVKMCKNMFKIIQQYNIYKLKEVESEILSGIVSPESAMKSVSGLGLNDYLKEKFSRLYCSCQGKNLYQNQFEGQVLISSDGIIDKLMKKELNLKNIVSGVSFRGFEFHILNQGVENDSRVCYVDGDASLGELIELDCQVGCQAVRQWWE